MIRIIRLFGVFVLAFVLALSLSGQTSAADKVEPLSLQRAIVVFDDGVSPVAQNALIESFGGKSIKSLDLINGSVVLLPPLAVKNLENCQEVLRVEPDDIVEAVLQSIPWGIDRIDAELVHPMNRGKGVKVAVIDTGVDYTHEDLDDNFNPNLLGYDFVNEDSDPMDDNGHGTHVAGIIAAEDNGIGVVGVAPEASLYALKIIGNSGGGYYSDLINALGWCVDNGIQVASMSIGFSNDYAPLHEACDNAYKAGVLLVAAAGNSGSNSILYPAKYNSVIAVSATDSSDNLLHSSNYGAQIELAAPGYSIRSTLMGGGYGTKSGTSIATPHVSGTAALIIASGITGSSAVRDQLDATVEDLGASGWDTYFGNGLVDAAAAASLPSSTGSIAGKVTDTDTTAPIANATVSAGGYSTTTASNGTYTLVDLPVDTYTVTTSASGYEKDSRIGVVVSKNQTATGVDFALIQPIGAISGIVADGSTGTAIANATVSAGGHSTTTTANGTYTLADLPVGTYTVTTSVPGYVNESQTRVKVSLNQTTIGIDFALVKSTGAISGAVADDGTGAPIANTVVSAGEYSTTTAADGTYTLADLPVGTYTVTTSVSDYIEDSLTEVVVSEDQTATGVDFALVQSTQAIDESIASDSTNSITASLSGNVENSQTTAGVDFDPAQQPDGKDIDIIDRSIDFSMNKTDRNTFLYVMLTLLATPILTALLRNRTSMKFRFKKEPAGSYVTEMTELTHSTYIRKEAMDVENPGDQHTT